MSALDVPETGLSLRREEAASSSDPNTKPTQIMRLNLAQNTLDDLIHSLQNDQTARIRLGKHQTLYYGPKSQQFHSCPETHRSEVYRGSAADNENLYFTGVLSHSLEVQKAKQDTAATDQALANLEQSLNAFERGKESKKTHIITDLDQVKALRTGGRKPTRKGELERERFLKTPANRSTPSSPGLGGGRSPISLPLTPNPTSAPLSQNKDRIRLDALKVPFIHLLAVRAVSAKFLARQTRSSVEDCLALAQKYGVENRLNKEKFDLRDKVYRDLDVWKFPYPSEEDRQEAIENAISAYDRQRISRSDKLWQNLLPKVERGKGKCLSRLDLRTGPIKKAVTPRIHVEDTGKDGDFTGPETDKPTGKDAASVRPPSPAAHKKPAGEKDASSKKASTTKTKSTTTNSTLTGRVTKKAERQPAPKPTGKFKSAEYVHDSDDEDSDMPDAPALEKPRPEKARSVSKPAKPATGSNSLASSTSKVGKLEQSAPKLEASQSTSKASASSKRLPSTHSSNSSSPQKPSPLGSSPPTNASDFPNRSRSSSGNQSASSSSSSPLIAQISRPVRPAGTTASSATPKPTKPNGVVKSTTATNPLKRKAETERPSISQSQPSARAHPNLEHKRRRAVSTSSGSTGSASPPLSYELLRQQLHEKSQKFKQFYAKYRTFYESMAAEQDPPREDLERLQKQHVRLQRMKNEIWDEDQRLREMR